MNKLAKGTAIRVSYSSGGDINIEGIGFISNKRFDVLISLDNCDFYRDIKITFKPNVPNIHEYLRADVDKSGVYLEYVAKARIEAKQAHYQISMDAAKILKNLPTQSTYVLFEYVIPNMEYTNPRIDLSHLKDELNNAEKKKLQRGIKGLTDNNFIAKVDNSHNQIYYLNFTYLRMGRIIDYIDKLVSGDFKSQISKAIIDSIKFHENGNTTKTY